MFKRARRLCLALPETGERTSWGHPNFRAGKKTFCAFEIIKGRPTIAFKVTPAQAGGTLHPSQFFASPYGRARWISVWVDGDVDWDAIARLVERSYRGVAIKRMLGALDGSGR